MEQEDGESFFPVKVLLIGRKAQELRLPGRDPYVYELVDAVRRELLPDLQAGATAGPSSSNRSRVRLIFRGRLLQEHRTMSQQGVAPHTILHCAVSPGSSASSSAARSAAGARHSARATRRRASGQRYDSVSDDHSISRQHRRRVVSGRNAVSPSNGSNGVPGSSSSSSDDDDGDGDDDGPLLAPDRDVETGQVIGFSRLQFYGFSPEEISTLRVQFHLSRLRALSPGGRVSSRQMFEELQSPHSRQLEEDWLNQSETAASAAVDGDGNSLAAGLSSDEQAVQRALGPKNDLFYGVLLGFALHLVIAPFLFEPGGSRRWKVGIAVGLLGNLVLGFLRNSQF